MSNNLEVRWNSLDPDPLDSVFSLIDTSHPVRIYIGKSITSERLLLIVTKHEPPNQKDMRLIGLKKIKKENGEWSLILTLKDISLSDIFSQLCLDIIESSRCSTNSDVGITLILKRLTGWRKLLEEGFSGILDNDSVRGLFGELHFLYNSMIPQLGKMIAVKAWVGPLKADQDFQTLETAWEIKTIRSNAVKVNISSERQLASHPNIFLIVITLNESMKEGGGLLTLNQLVTKIRQLLSDDIIALSDFEDKIFEAKYIHHKEYDTPFFIVEKELRLKVTDGFPCIKPLDLKPGVSEVTYQLQLDFCSDFIVKNF